VIDQCAGGGVLVGHLGFPFPSPVLSRQLGERFRRAVASFADTNDIPWGRFGKGEAKLEVMTPHLARQAATGRSGVAAIGVAQEFQRVWTAYEGTTFTGTPRWSFVKSDRRVTCYYFYCGMRGFGPAFIKVCAYFPYPAKIWLNGHEWVKRQAARAGIALSWTFAPGRAKCGTYSAREAPARWVRAGRGRRSRPREELPPTRFPSVRRSVHDRPRPSVTWNDRDRRARPTPANLRK
jgi:hypothetical protein